MTCPSMTPTFLGPLFCRPTCTISLLHTFEALWRRVVSSINLDVKLSSALGQQRDASFFTHSPTSCEISLVAFLISFIQIQKKESKAKIVHYAACNLIYCFLMSCCCCCWRRLVLLLLLLAMLLLLRLLRLRTLLLPLFKLLLLPLGFLFSSLK